MPSVVDYINIGGRVALLVTSTISLGLEGHLHTIGYNIARVNLGIASSVFGLALSVLGAGPLIYLGNTLTHGLLLIFDFISFALFLSAAASLTNQRHICHTPGHSKCGEFRAGIAFLYMDWIFLLLLLGIEAYEVITGASGIGGSGNYKTHRTPLGIQPGVGQPAVEKSEPGYADTTAPTTV